MGVDIGRSRAKQADLRNRRLIIPQSSGKLIRWSSPLDPNKYTEVPSFPLYDYLYNRGRAISDLIRAELSWRLYLTRQPSDVQEAIDKISRLFRFQNKSDKYV